MLLKANVAFAINISEWGVLWPWHNVYKMKDGIPVSIITTIAMLPRSNVLQCLQVYGEYFDHDTMSS